MIVRDFQSVIGREARQQCLERWAGCPIPSSPASAAGATRPECSIRSSTMPSVELIGVEAGGRRTQAGRSRFAADFGQPGILHGSFSYVMQDEDGQTCDVHSMSAGLGLSGRRPGTQLLESIRDRVGTTIAQDGEAMEAFDTLGT